MPKSTVKEENPYKLPEGLYLPAQMNLVTEKSIPYQDKQSGERKTFVKWIWEFQITGGEFRGLKSEGETEAKITVLPDGSRNKAAMWIEALRGMAVDFGEGIDTDDYNGLPCVITVSHNARERTDGQGFFYSEPVKDVYPDGSMQQAVGGQTGQGAAPQEEPPF